MAKPKLPVQWRRNAYSVELAKDDPHFEADRSSLLAHIPSLKLALARGWEVVIHVATDSKQHSWGSLTIECRLEFFSNGTLLGIWRTQGLEEAVKLAEIIARCVPNSYIVTGSDAQPEASFDLKSANDLLEAEPPELEWHVPGLMPAGLPTLLSGDGGTGKSLAAAQLAVATVTGRSWLGHTVRQGACIYMSAEDDENEIHRRLDVIARSEGISRPALWDLHINAKVGEDALLGVLNPDSRCIEPTALYTALERAVQKTEPALLILDTLADLFGGDENVRSQARQFVGLLRRLSLHCGTTVLCLSHPSVAGINSGTGSSGSTGWSNSVRSRLYLERVMEWRGRGDARRLVEVDPDVRILTTKKANYGRTGGSTRLRWKDGVLERDLILFSETSAKVTEAAADSTAAVDDLFLSMLISFTAEGRNVGPSPSSSFAPMLFAKDQRSGGVKKAAFAAAMGRLLADRRLAIEPYGPPSRGTKRLSLAANAPADPPADRSAD